MPIRRRITMIEKTKLDITFLLPSVQDIRDACIQRLSDSLKSKDGIDQVHLSNTNLDGTGQICIHYDPNRISIGEVRELAKRAGADLGRRFGHLLIAAETLTASRALTIEARMRRVSGILEISVSPAGMVRIEFDRESTDEGKVRAALDKLVLTETKAETAPAERAEDRRIAVEEEYKHRGVLGEQTELVFAAMCGILLFAAWLLSSFSQINFWVPLPFDGSTGGGQPMCARHFNTKCCSERSRTGGSRRSIGERGSTP